MDKPTLSTLNEQTAARMADLFASLSDPTRLRILSILMVGETNVGDLVQEVGLSKSAVSHQLRSLRDKRVIRTRKQGRQVFVMIDDEHIAELFQRGLDHVNHE
jgi:ArsR family transcriptional regulator, lead/cadmium/zinc/bismuth-responsive transcriptional repressor